MCVCVCWNGLTVGVHAWKVTSINIGVMPTLQQGGGSFYWGNIQQLVVDC